MEIAHIQMELIEIQNDSNLKHKFNKVGVPDFYNSLPVRYVETRRFSCKISLCLVVLIYMSHYSP